jgi:hypothetical protein
MKDSPQQRYRKRHPEQYREYDRKYYEQNKEKRLEKSRKWKKANPEKRRAACKKYRERHPDNHKNQLKKYLSEWISFLELHDMTKCSRCGYKKCFAAIDFHHKNSNKKTIEIGRLIRSKLTQKTAEKFFNEEVDPLCKNCHAELHWMKTENDSL